MGLDQYAYLAKKTKGLPDVCKLEDVEIVNDDFAYWRKNYSLHRWAEGIASMKGFDGRSGDFNCLLVRLKKKDIKSLRKEAKSWKFGDDFAYDKEWFESAKKNTLRFCKKALKAIDKGYAVYYDSSW